MVELAIVSEYIEYLNSHAWPIPAIPARPTPFQQFGVWSSLHRLFRIATRGVMEILGLDPYQSETQYLEGFFRDLAERKYGGNPFPPYFLFISTLFPLPFVFAPAVEIEWKYISALFPLQQGSVRH
jgi:hypothetical protein